MIHLEFPVYTLMRNALFATALCLVGIGIPFIVVAETNNIAVVSLDNSGNCDDGLVFKLDKIVDIKPKPVATAVPVIKPDPARPRPVPRKPKPTPKTREIVKKPSSTSIVKTANLAPTPTYSDYQGVIWFLKTHENFIKKAKWDHKQYTYGWGNKADYKGQNITLQKANEIFVTDIDMRYANLIKDYPNLKRDRFAGLLLTNLIFNIGTKKKGRANLYKAIGAYDKNIPSTVRRLGVMIKRYVNASGVKEAGLVTRRNAEVELLLAAPEERQRLYEIYRKKVVKITTQ